MPKAVPIINSFNAGEWSPRLAGRTDQEKYYAACRRMENMFSHVHGGATRRSGMRYVADVKSHSARVRLIPFQFSTEQAYVLEFGNLYMRVFKNQGQVLTAGGTIYEIATPYVTADLRGIKFCQSADVMYLAHQNYAPRKLSRTGHAAWTLSTVTFEAPLNPPTNVAASWGGSGATTTYFYKITSVNEYQAESIASSAGSADAGTAIVASSPITVTWSAATDAVEYNVYREKNGVYGKIGKAIGTTFKDVGDTDPDVTDTPPSAENPFNAAGSYPRTVTFYEQRLCWGGTSNDPITLWTSRTSDFENMNKSNPTRDDDACEFSLNANQVNAIRWLVPSRKLLIGTAGAEWYLAGSGGDPLTPTSVDANQETQYGSADIVPVVCGGVILFVDRTGKIIREFLYDYDSDGYVAPAISILAEHMTRTYPILEWSYQQSPHSIVWCVRSDGVLVGLTYLREHQVTAFHRHVTDGKVESVAVIAGTERDELWLEVKRTINGNTKRFIEVLEGEFDPASAPDGAPDSLDAFFVDAGLSYENAITMTAATTANPVKITAAAHGLSDGDDIKIFGVSGMTELNGNTYEVAAASADFFSLLDTAGASVDGSAYTAYTEGGEVHKIVTTISGLDHLALETVDVLVDGATQAQKTVTAGGSITVSPGGCVIHAGLHFDSWLEPMYLDAGAADGTSQARLKNYNEITFRVADSINMQVGPDEDNLDTISFRDWGDPFGVPPDVFTGDKTKDWPGGWDEHGRIVIKQDAPLPLTVLAIIPHVNTMGK
jgi:fibronectin type 3 domain-containing protein